VKDQYFGDVNDYRKYGLLRAILAGANVRLGVCWMLTAPDSRTDGRHVAYLDNPTKFRRFDHELFVSGSNRSQTASPVRDCRWSSSRKLALIHIRTRKGWPISVERVL
jgi:hypothetical protein